MSDTRGLEETIAAQAQRLGELAKLRDIAHVAKQRLIGEHAEERAKRQALEVVVAQAQVVIADLATMLDRSPTSLVEAYALLDPARAWLAEHGMTA